MYIVYKYICLFIRLLLFIHCSFIVHCLFIRLLLFSKDLKYNFSISSSTNSTMKEENILDYTGNDNFAPSFLTVEKNKEEIADIDEEKFKAWLNQQSEFSKNVESVCRKYGYTLRKRVPVEAFIYDSEHDLLFCRNAKVCCKHFC